jgi:hypothetical protein
MAFAIFPHLPRCWKRWLSAVSPSTTSPAVAELKQSGDLSRRCRCRTSSHVNNVIERDHRFTKERGEPRFPFGRGRMPDDRRLRGDACRSKGQIRWIAKGDPVTQRSVHPHHLWRRRVAPSGNQSLGRVTGQPRGAKLKQSSVLPPDLVAARKPLEDPRMQLHLENRLPGRPFSITPLKGDSWSFGRMQLSTRLRRPARFSPFGGRSVWRPDARGCWLPS